EDGGAADVGVVVVEGVVVGEEGGFVGEAGGGGDAEVGVVVPEDGACGPGGGEGRKGEKSGGEIFGGHGVWLRFSAVWRLIQKKNTSRNAIIKLCLQIVAIEMG